MHPLLAFHADDPAKLLALANRLNQRGTFPNCLSSVHAAVLSYILSLNSLALWSNFLDGNCVLSLAPDPAGSVSKDQADPIFDNHRNVTAFAMRVRYLLYEHAIDYLYPSSSPATDNDLIQNLNTEESPPTPTEQQPKPVHAEEDDYDDDDEDDDDKQNDNKQNNNNSNTRHDPMDIDSGFGIEYNAANQVILRVPLFLIHKASEPDQSFPATVPSGLEPSASDKSPLHRSLVVLAAGGDSLPLEHSHIFRDYNKIYHSFEYDRETLLKRRKLEHSDLQLQDSRTLDASPRRSDASALDVHTNTNSMGIDLGPATSSLQHLLSTILLRRDRISLNDQELRSLFLDVRKNKGKWASDERVGQEELYEACEKVVLELRGYTEHSTPFLNKVSKREAPNYMHVIKKPMDLNTVMKKLKSLSYHSKQQFVDDLMLIWSNCLTFNADPKHFLRAHAIAMQKKSLKLIPSIPNITVISRDELDKEEGETKADALVEDEDTDSSSKLLLKKGRKRSRRGEMIAHQDPAETGTPASVDDQNHNAAEAQDVDMVAKSGHEGNGLENGDAFPEDDEDIDDEEEEEDTNNEIADSFAGDDDADSDLQAWRSLTAKIRAQFCARRLDLFAENGELRLDADALVRSQSRLQAHASPRLPTVANSSHNPYLLEYDVTGVIPEMAYEGTRIDREDEEENRLAETYLENANGNASNIVSGFALPTDSGLNKMYIDNITEAQEIRKVCFKISLIRQMQTQLFIHHTQLKAPNIERLKEVDVDAALKLPTRDPFSKQVQFSALKRSACKIAMQTGFESTEPTAINALTQIAERYMSNLIKSLKLHSESNSVNKLIPRDILLLSLLENGVGKPDDLYTFIQEKIAKQYEKLQDLRRKLSNFLKELLRPGLKNINELNFEDNSEQFLTGDFSSNLGDDFFGFRELGLDKEFDLLTTSIPVNLLHSRLHNLYTSSGTISKSDKYDDLDEYEPKPLKYKDIGLQIKLLQPFYQALWVKSKSQFVKTQRRKGEPSEILDEQDFVLMEDEEMPQKQRNIRPRLPPTGKIASIKKKPIATSFFIPDDETPILEESSAPAAPPSLFGDEDDDQDEKEDDENKNTTGMSGVGSALSPTPNLHESLPSSSALSSPSRMVKTEHEQMTPVS